MVSRVFEICNAYESGYGHGYNQDGKDGEYYSDPDLNEAYKIGYQAGQDGVDCFDEPILPVDVAKTIKVKFDKPERLEFKDTNPATFYKKNQSEAESGLPEEECICGKGPHGFCKKHQIFVNGFKI